MSITVSQKVNLTRSILTVLVLTGVNLGNPVGAIATASAESSAITPQNTGSVIFGAEAFAWETGGSFPFTPYDANTTILDDESAFGGPGGFSGCTFRLTGTTTAATPVTLGVSSGAGGYDILPAITLVEINTSGTLAVDASTPPSCPGTDSSSGYTPGTQTTNSFNPPQGAVLLALVAGEYNAGSATAVTDSGGLYTWKLVAANSGGSGETTAIWMGVPLVTGPSAALTSPAFSNQYGPLARKSKRAVEYDTKVAGQMTVTATASNAYVGGNIALQVVALTGAQLNQASLGAVTVTETFGSPAVSSITPLYSGSLIYGAVITVNSVATTYSANSVTGLVSPAVGLVRGAQTNYFAACYSKAVTVSGTPVSFGPNASYTSENYYTLAAEIVANGTLAQDMTNTPAQVSTNTGNTVSTATFTPAPGSVLLAMVGTAGYGTLGPAVAITDSVGLVWTLLTTGNYSGGSEVFIFSAQVSAGVTAVTAAGASGSERMSLSTYVLTGANLGSPTGNVAGTGGGAITQALTPAYTGSLIFGQFTSLTNSSSVSGLTYTAATTGLNSNDFIYDSYASVGFRSTATTTASTPVTTGLTDSADWQNFSQGIAVAEIRKSAGGTLAIDATSPGALNSANAVSPFNPTMLTAYTSSLTSASFVPPGASIAVALVTYQVSNAAQKVAVTDTAGAYVWTCVADSALSGTSTDFNYAQVWVGAPVSYSGSPSTSVAFTATNTGNKVSTTSPAATTAFTASCTGTKAVTVTLAATVAFTATCTGVDHLGEVGTGIASTAFTASCTGIKHGAGTAVSNPLRMTLTAVGVSHGGVPTAPVLDANLITSSITPVYNFTTVVS